MRRATTTSPATRWRLALGLAAAALLASGCARVGAPEPPLKHLPPAPAPVTAAQEAATLVVSCRLPVSNTDGSEIKGYRRLEVLGVLAPPGAVLDALPAALPVVADWNEATLPAQLRERRFAARLNLAGRFGGSEGTVVVSIRFMNDRGRWSPPSPALRCPAAPVADPPPGAAAAPSQTGVALQWDEPAGNFDGKEEYAVGRHGPNSSNVPDSRTQLLPNAASPTLYPQPLSIPTGSPVLGSMGDGGASPLPFAFAASYSLRVEP